MQGHLGHRFLLEEAPDNEFPAGSMEPLEAMRLIEADLTLEGIPERNLATFVTTWMEPEARHLISTNLHRNFIDHAEYPQTAEIEQRCIRMLADLFHAPGETTGARTQGSSEAIMLGALSLKWQWRKRREAAGAADRQTEPRVRRRRPRRLGEVLPLLRRRAAGSSRSSPTSTRSGPRTSSPMSTRTRSAWRPSWERPSPGTPTTSSASTSSWSTFATSAGSTCRSTSMAPAAGSSGRSSTPTTSGTSASSRCARSTSPATSSGWSIPASAG